MRHVKSISATLQTLPGLRQCANLLLPPVCLLCGTPGQDLPICPACRAELPPLLHPCCPICLEATAYGERCAACLAHPPHFERLFALYRYTFPVDRLILNLKYNARFALAHLWSDELATQLLPLAGMMHRVIPLPLHAERLSGRGYNQALEIARPLAQSLGIPLDISSLEKCRATSSQARSSLDDRRRNLKNAFVCNSDLSGERILLVDDVLTTGTTLNEAARVLKARGAFQVLAAVVARTNRLYGKK
jgi:ComF family protein